MNSIAARRKEKGAAANIGAEERGLAEEINTRNKQIAKHKEIIANPNTSDYVKKQSRQKLGVQEEKLAAAKSAMAILKDKETGTLTANPDSIGAGVIKSFGVSDKQRESGNIAIGKDVKNTALMEFLSSSREAQLIAMQVMGESVKAADSGRMYSDSGGMGGGQAGGSSTTTQNVSTTTTNYRSGIPMSEQYRMRTTVGRLVAGGRVGGM